MIYILIRLWTSTSIDHRQSWPLSPNTIWQCRARSHKPGLSNCGFSCQTLPQFNMEPKHNLRKMILPLYKIWLNLGFPAQFFQMVTIFQIIMLLLDFWTVLLFLVSYFTWQTVPISPHGPPTEKAQVDEADELERVVTTGEPRPGDVLFWFFLWGDQNWWPLRSWIHSFWVTTGEPRDVVWWFLASAIGR